MREFDTIIVGGGPAGLTAAIYLGRFHISALLIDSGASRAAEIPLSLNLPGFPGGINGSDLLGRMLQQARLYGTEYKQDTVVTIWQEQEHFVVATNRSEFTAATVLMATGVSNRRPDMPDQIHDNGLKKGLIRYCPICDGHEVTDQAIGVLGGDLHAVNEAVFLRSYSKDITLVSSDDRPLDEPLRMKLSDLGIKYADGPCKFTLSADWINVGTPSGTHKFRAIYPALGSEVNSALAIDLKANRSQEGNLLVDRHQLTNIEGLYAAGDVVLGLDQITNAMGQGSIAATAIRNRVSAHRSLLR